MGKLIKLILFTVITIVVTALSFNAYAAGIKLVPEKVTHVSSLLNTEKSMLIFKPRNFDPEKRYPVLYLLHCVGYDYKGFNNNTKLATYLANYDMFVVCPDGTSAAPYLDSDIIANAKHESYITQELIPFIDSHYQTINDRRARAICGFSAGGHGAISIAIKHQDLFGSASCLAAVLDITKHTDSADFVKILGKPSKTNQTWDANSATKLVLNGKLQPKALSLFISVGLSDFTLQENRDFHQALSLFGIPHSYIENFGSHDWVYVSDHLEENLLFHDRLFKKFNDVTK